MKRKFEDTLDNTTIVNKFAKLSVTTEKNVQTNDTNTNLDDVSILYIIENGMASRQLIHQMYTYYNTNTNTNYKYNKNYINEFFKTYNIYKLSQKIDKEVELELYKQIYKIHQI